MHQRSTLTRWRKIVVVAGSLAVLAAGAGTVANQAFADSGKPFSPTTTGGVIKAFDATKEHTTDQASRDVFPAPDCSDKRADLQFTAVPEAGEALKAAVSSVAGGTISEVRGDRTSATCHHPEAVGASLMLAPADGSADVQISTAFLAPGEFDWAGGAEAYVSTCNGGKNGPLENCRLSTLPDGTKLRTISFSQPSGGVETTWQVAERLVDGYIVNVNVIGPEVELSIDQLVDLVSQLTPTS